MCQEAELKFELLSIGRLPAAESETQWHTAQYLFMLALRSTLRGTRWFVPAFSRGVLTLPDDELLKRLNRNQ